MLRTITKWSVFLYALAIIILGAVGYHLKGSKISFIAGSGMGGLLLLSSVAMFMKKKKGAYAALILTALLTAEFAYRYSKTGSQLAALFAVLSGAMLIFLLVQLARWKK